MDKTLEVLYQSDDNYAMVSGISIRSLLENNQHLECIIVYYCSHEISAHNKKNLQSIVGDYKNAKLQFVNTQKYYKRFKELKVKPWHGVYITWLKLLAFGDLPLKTDRVLFINGHTIINGKLDGLLDYDFQNNVMALAYDCLLNGHKRTIGLRETDGYFNCGIMLINHTQWIKDDVTQEIQDHLSQKSDYVIADQDLCNVLFKNRIGLLDVTYNFSSAYYAYDLKMLMRTNDLRPAYFYSYQQIMESYYAPVIIHSLFGVLGKPWEVGNQHPQKYLWGKYLAMTPWADAKIASAKRSKAWYLYKLLPNRLFMILYKIGVKRKFC